MAKIDVYVVQSLALANYLCRQGNDIIKIEDSKKDPTRKNKVCIFKETDKLHEDINTFMLNKSQENGGSVYDIKNGD